MPGPRLGSNRRRGRRPPVKWLELGQLRRTGTEVSRSLEFAQYADQRAAQATAPGANYDLRSSWAESQPGDRPYVVDYVADTGDGYDATFAVAASVNGLCGHQSADLLVFGGDEVYPVASIPDYENRLIRPFRDALNRAQADAKEKVAGSFLAALPGNHDWYDGLVAFRRLFCESWVSPDAPIQLDLQPVASATWRDEALGRGLFQSRSYFAARLPYGWWLWAIDSQLDASVDTAQLAYFERAVRQVLPEEKVILCIARPSWIDAESWRDDFWMSNKRIMTWFVNRMFSTPDEHDSGNRRDQVPVILSGDKHYYARYQRSAEDRPQDGPSQLITCGGGGAFLAATHHLRDELSVEWERDNPTPYCLAKLEDKTAAVFPSRKKSKELRRGWWQIPFANGFGLPLLLILLQILPGLAFWQASRQPSFAWWLATALLTAVPLVGCIVFTVALSKSKPWPRRFALGTIHGIARAALAVAWGRFLLESTGSGHRWLLVLLSVVVVGVLAVWGLALFLRIADSLGLHDNELFSAMAISDFKSHLRLTIHPPRVDGHAGALGITVIGIESVTKNLRTQDPSPSKTKIIETIEIRETTSVDADIAGAQPM